MNSRSHLDGAHRRFSLETSIQIQHLLRAGIIFAFDKLTSLLRSYDYQVESLERTRRWAERYLREHRRLTEVHKDKPCQILFGVIQGAQWEDLRHKAARGLGLMCVDGQAFDGFGTGGALEKENLGRIRAWVVEELLEDRPRYPSGVSELEDLFAGIGAGADTFGCMSPSRVARNGAAHLETGRASMSHVVFREDFSPMQPGRGCYTYRNYIRAYIHRLLKTEETLASTLLTIHNEYYMVHVAQDIHVVILADEDACQRSKQEALGKLGRL